MGLMATDIAISKTCHDVYDVSDVPYTSARIFVLVVFLVLHFHNPESLRKSS